MLLQHLKTVPIASGRVLSEAFQDGRAARLFHAPPMEEPRSEGNALFFALPVNIIEDDVELLVQLGCTSAKGFSGTFIWRIDAKFSTDDSKSVSASAVRVAAVPSTCAPCFIAVLMTSASIHCCVSACQHACWACIVHVCS